MVERNVAAKVPHNVEQGSHSELRFIVDRAIYTASREKTIISQWEVGAQGWSPAAERDSGHRICNEHRIERSHQ